MTTPFAEPYTITRRRIPEYPGAGRLGRHYAWDSRSGAYEYLSDLRPGAAKTVLWERMVPILDQGAVGSCTGNAEVGLLGSAPFYATVKDAAILDEAEALKLYSAAETIDGDGPYPPNDNGSTGASVMKAAKAAHLISGYQHAATVSAMVTALQAGPVIAGVTWYDSFDTPDADGLITIAAGAQVRGGHEFVVRGIDVASELFTADNSWGTGWGDAGSFRFTADTMAALFAQEGDCTVAVPLSSPPPSPRPPSADAADRALAAAQATWRKARGL